MQIFCTSAYCGKYNCFNFVHLLLHNNVNHSKHIWAHRYIAKSHLKMDVCSRSLSPPIDKTVDSFPFVPKERRVLRTPSSFCLSKWGAASSTIPGLFQTSYEWCEALSSIFFSWGALRAQISIFQVCVTFVSSCLLSFWINRTSWGSVRSHFSRSDKLPKCGIKSWSYRQNGPN